MHMIYLIENQIVFNPEDNSLSLLSDTESKITVSNPARRILSLLIEYQGTVVERETFFKKVWDDYGLTASNNNLNHCISKLRKVILTLGYTGELIITVPKVGFIIRKETDITPQFDLTLAKENVDSPNEDTIALPENASSASPDSDALMEFTASVGPEPEKAIPTLPQKRNNKLPFIFSMLFLLLMATWSLNILHSIMSDPKAKLQIAKLGACELYSTTPVSLSREEDFIQLAQAFITKQKITCSPGSLFIFQSEQFTIPINTGSVRDFMAQCSINENHKINICISYYANDRTTHDKF